MTGQNTVGSGETPADVIRRAAALMRRRAEAAAGGPWTASPVWSTTPAATSAVYSLAHPSGSVESEVVASGRVDTRRGGIRDPYNAVHIAAWHPTVALAVADWLDAEADAYEQTALLAEQLGVGALRPQSRRPTLANALAVARAFLGEQPGTAHDGDTEAELVVALDGAPGDPAEQARLAAILGRG